MPERLQLAVRTPNSNLNSNHLSKVDFKWALLGCLVANEINYKLYTAYLTLDCVSLMQTDVGDSNLCPNLVQDPGFRLKSPSGKSPLR